ncbi:MAG: M48 family metallopeptidase [Planctomycetes bacterium]|nr:M48 family metallopeptidase [Planctomycetota bacterium]
MTTHQISYAGRDIPFSLQLGQRKRVRIEVLPSGRVQVLAPAGTARNAVLQVVQRKARWIARQQRYFQQFEPRTTTREYVSGETHLYLGRRYRLKVHAVDGAEHVKLAGGYLHVFCKEAGDQAVKRRLLDDWYKDRAVHVFADSLVRMQSAKPFSELEAPALSIRRMRRRWGSCTAAGRILLNLYLIRAPRRCIDYVVAHELCHLVVPNHSGEFVRLLRRVVPDWEARKALLEQIAA